MSTAPAQLPLEFRLLGQVDFDSLLKLQSRIQRDAYRAVTPQVTVLLCEHPRLLTVGRDGSRSHIRLTQKHLNRMRLDVRWAARRGGCVPHGPGQLGIYVIAPLEPLELACNELARTFRQSLMAALSQLGVSAKTDLVGGALWGRTGVLASLGVTAQDGVTGFGAYLNVNPDMSDYAYVDTAESDEFEQTSMGSLIAETRSAGRMSKVRSAIIESISEALGAPRYHLTTGHPLLSRSC